MYLGEPLGSERRGVDQRHPGVTREPRVKNRLFPEVRVECYESEEDDGRCRSQFDDDERSDETKLLQGIIRCTGEGLISMLVMASASHGLEGGSPDKLWGQGSIRSYAYELLLNPTHDPSSMAIQLNGSSNRRWTRLESEKTLTVSRADFCPRFVPTSVEPTLVTSEIHPTEGPQGSKPCIASYWLPLLANLFRR